MPTHGLDERSTREILQNIMRTLGCREEEIRNFRPGPSGMMNRSYCFRVGEGEYLYRRPGPGTNALYILGTLLIALAGAGLLMLRRRKA